MVLADERDHRRQSKATAQEEAGGNKLRKFIVQGDGVLRVSRSGNGCGSITLIGLDV